jgi:hypothetical protein
MENRPNRENIECTFVFCIVVYFIEHFRPCSIRNGNILYECMSNCFERISSCAFEVPAMFSMALAAAV